MIKAGPHQAFSANGASGAERYPSAAPGGKAPSSQVGQSAVAVALAGKDAGLQLDFWQGVTPGAYEVASRVKRALPLEATLQFRRLDRIAMSRFSSRSYIVSRSDRSVRRYAGRFVKIKLFVQGGAILCHGGSRLRLDRGAVHIIDQSRSWNAVYDDHEQLSVFLPHHTIGYQSARHPVCTSFPVGSPTGRVLASAVCSLFGCLTVVDTNEANAFADGFAALVRQTLSGTAPDSSIAAARSLRLEAMKAFIDRHIDDSELGIDRLVVEFRLSRATVFRDFAALGGVANYVRARRLERAFHELMHNPGQRGIVTATAERWHFASASHFSEAFFYHFGARPGEIVGLRREAAALDTAPVSALGSPPAIDLGAAQLRLRHLYARFTQ